MESGPSPPHASAGGMLSAPRGVCAITGASGYVGSLIAGHLAGAGWHVRALCRSKPDLCSDRISHLSFDLAAPCPPPGLEGADVLVHAAYDFGHVRWRDVARVNIDGSRHLLAAAQSAGVKRIVCVSTIAAFPGARSMYGRAKLEIERMTIDAGGAVIRPGLVWGPEGAAMFGTLRRAVELLPVVPMVVPPDTAVPSVYEYDLALFLEQLLAEWPDGSGRLFVAASKDMLTFGQLVRSLSPQGHRSPHLVGIPWLVVWLWLRALEAVGIKPMFASDRLVSLVNPDSDPLGRATADAERYGVRFRPYSLT
jgi:nucleoside-diphosphate-sugar epimerase